MTIKYSHDLLAVWFYQEKLKSKHAIAVDVLESCTTLTTAVKGSKQKEFQNELGFLLKKYGIAPRPYFAKEYLILNGDVADLKILRQKCGLDENGDRIIA